MQKQALEINERLGRLEGMAYAHGNLGIYQRDRGDENEARRHLTEARDLFSKIGMPHMIKEVQSLLDALPLEGTSR
jgi:hypothetical protein